MKIINPDTITKPASHYAQGIVHSNAGERLVISGQIGVSPEGKIEEGLEAQTERAWMNIFGVLADAGFEKEHLVKIVTYVTIPGSVAVAREVRDRMLDGHICASTYLEISGLASPDFVVEIEAEAVKE